MRVVWLLLTFLNCTRVALHAADWPQRSGPYQNNSTSEVVKPWKGALRADFQIPLDEGYSGPTVADKKLFLHTKVKGKNAEEVIAADAMTGKVLWRQEYNHKAFESEAGNGPRYSPTYLRGKLYTYGISGELRCWDTESGKVDWGTNLLEEAQAPIMKFGASAGPLIVGSQLFLPVGNPGKCLYCLNPRTGETQWHALNAAPMGTTTALFAPVVKERTLRQLIFTTQRGYLGVDLRDGSVLWEFPISDVDVETLPPPTVAGDLFIVSSMRTGTFGVKLDEENGKLIPREVWRNPKVTTYFTQNIVGAADRLYALQATLDPAADIALVCLDLKTGKEIWRQPKIGIYQLNMIRMGDDKLLMLDDLAGDLILLDTAAAEYRELSRSKVCNPTIISPAFANGRLYTRDDRGAYCHTLEIAKPD